MTHADSPDQAEEFARLALSLMDDRGIAKTPEHYALWYAYAAGRNPDLRRDLDVLLDNGQAADPARLQEIHARYLGNGADEPIREVVEHLRGEIAELLQSLAGAGNDAARYGRSLASFGERLSSARRIEDLAAAVTEVIAETRTIAHQNQELHTRLGQATVQIGRLKEDLRDVRREAKTDPLTGLYNRKLFDAQLRIEMRRAAQKGEHLALLIIDIDHFKRFNDTYGHQIGDQVLRLLGRTLLDNLKGQDTAARYGGEEFAVILPTTNLRDATRLAESIRRAVGEKEVRNRTSGQVMGRISVSVGVAAHVLGEPVDQFILRADRALYLAKGTGRNRVVTQEEVARSSSAASG